LKTENAS